MNGPSAGWFGVAAFAVLAAVALAGVSAHADAARPPSAVTAEPTLPSGAGAPTPGGGAEPTEAPGSALPVPGPGLGALVDAAWAADVASRTGVPLRALQSYAGASLLLEREQPGCRLGWTTLAAIGATESGHGTHGGSSLDAAGTARPPIVGAALDGGAYDAIADTDAGASDGDASWDRALGPFQFIPSTWQRWGADGNGDGQADIQNIDDAAVAAGRYLCHYGDLAQPGSWRDAVFAYNHDASYVDGIAGAADALAALAG